MSSELRLSVQAGGQVSHVSLASDQPGYVFGRGTDVSWVIPVASVSKHHCAFSFVNGQWCVSDLESANGTFLNGAPVRPGQLLPLAAGSQIWLCSDGAARIEVLSITQEAPAASPAQQPATTPPAGQPAGYGNTRPMQSGQMPPAMPGPADPFTPEPANFTIYQPDAFQGQVRRLDLTRGGRIVIGRAPDCTVVLDNPNVSKHHCEVSLSGAQILVTDLNSTNGTCVNGRRVRRCTVNPGDVINVPGQVFIIEGMCLVYHERTAGISVELVNVVKTVKDRETQAPLDIVRHVSMIVRPNTFVALVGGSGAGKSSLLTCINGTAPCTGGTVRFDGLDTRLNRHAYDAIVGNVPQKDILHENLTVRQSLQFMARLRIAGDVSRRQLDEAVAKAIRDVDLNGKENVMISNLSGGQKKRVSIAMELLANPRLLILDEPTSGLSPDLDRALMQLMKRLSRRNCTVLLVTHCMDNIRLCDSVAFLGRGGSLCYYGAPDKMRAYFGVEDMSDVFVKLSEPENVARYAQAYYSTPAFQEVSSRYPEAAMGVTV